MEVTTNQNILQKISSDLELSNQCQRFNGNMAAAINRYNQEIAAWYDDRIPMENAFSTTTQDLWYQHYLNKKRLKRRGIGVHFEYVDGIQYPKESNQKSSFFYTQDGKNLVCEVMDDISYKKVWYREQCVLWVEQPDQRQGYYYFIQAKNVQGQCVCPNCGHAGSLEEMVDGCDFCGTNFYIEDYNEKLSSFYLPNSIVKTRNHNMAYYITIPVGWLALGLFVVSKSGRSSLGIGIVVLVFFIIVVIMTLINDKKGSARNTVTKRRIREIDPHFSEETFIAGLITKLLSIHYAERLEEIQPFMICNISSYLAEYQDIVECSFVDYVLDDYSCDEKFQYLTVTVNLEFKCDEQPKIVTKKEKLHINLYKRIEVRTNLCHPAVIYTCEGCGASLTLLNGGKCEFCGKMLDLTKYDWVIKEYRKC